MEIITITTDIITEIVLGIIRWKETIEISPHLRYILPIPVRILYFPSQFVSLLRSFALILSYIVLVPYYSFIIDAVHYLSEGIDSPIGPVIISFESPNNSTASTPAANCNNNLPATPPTNQTPDLKAMIHTKVVCYLLSRYIYLPIYPSVAPRYRGQY